MKKRGKGWEEDKGEAMNLQIGSHDNEEVSPFCHLRFEEFGISNGLLRRVNGARSDDNENSIIIAC